MRKNAPIHCFLAIILGILRVRSRKIDGERMKKATIIVSVLILFLVADSKLHSQNGTKNEYSNLHEKQQSVLETLYDKWYSPPIRRVLTKRVFSQLAGKWAKSKRSKSMIPRFIKAYDINVDEIEKPIDFFVTFNDFFIRTLKPKARPLPSDPSAIISPADGNALAIQNISKDSLFPIKNLSFSTAKILKSEYLSKLFQEGTAIIIRLAPWDYHRVHFPLSGFSGQSQVIAGQFQSVSPIVFQAGIQPIEINERHIIEFQPDKSSTMAVVMVGALFVGAMVETYIPGTHYEQGNELGYFEYGGSTMVLFFQKNTVTINPEIIAASKLGIETPVKMGQVIGHILPEKKEQKIVKIFSYSNGQ